MIVMGEYTKKYIWILEKYAIRQDKFISYKLIANMDLLTLEFSRGPLNTLPHFDPWHPTCIVFVTLKRYRSKYFKIYACRNKCRGCNIDS